MAAAKQTATGKPRATILGYLLGVVLIVGGIAWGGYLAVQGGIGAAKVVSEKGPIQNVGVPIPAQDETVTLPEAGKYGVYVHFDGREELSRDNQDLKEIARAVQIDIVSAEEGKAVSVTGSSDGMTLEMNGNVAFGVMSVETGGARKLTVSTRMVESSLPADPNAMARVQKMQVYLGRVNLGGVGGKLQTAGMVAGGGIVLGIVVIVITAIRRSKPAPQPVANPYQDRPSEPPVSGQSPSAGTPGQGGRQIPPPQQ